MKDSSEFFIHESSYFDEGCEIGCGTKIWHFGHIMGGARIGKNCSIGQNVFVGNNAVIGDYCKIQNNVSVYDRVILESGVFCGPSCVFTNVINPRSLVERKDAFRKTLVRKGATIGANATIICGVTLGRYCLVGAGSTVTRNVQDYAVVYGVPARQHGWICECGVILDKTLRCMGCKKRYKILDDKLYESVGNE